MVLAAAMVPGLLAGPAAAQARSAQAGRSAAHPRPAWAALASQCTSPPGAVRCHPRAGTPAFPVRTHPVYQVRQLVHCGSMMYAVGTFNRINGYSAASKKRIVFHRHNAFSFQDSPPFAVSGWNPDVNGTVNSIALSPDCSTAYLGGSFSQVHGKTASNIARVRTSDGSLKSRFDRNANGTVETLLMVHGRLLAGGFFTSINGSGRSYYAGLNASTGRDDGYLKLAISGHYQFPGVHPNHTRVYNQQLSHGGNRLLAEGDFTSVGGKHRQQIFMLSLGASSAHVTSWTSNEFNRNCWTNESFYIRAASWSPDDKTVYIAATGNHPFGTTKRGERTGLCDAASAFPAKLRAVSHRWINYTGCDSMYATVASGNVAYFGGHERWADNSHGCNRAGRGAITAPGMVGLSTSGKVKFNPTRARGRGADDMILTAGGLWIASDNFDGSQACGGRNGFSGICFLPYPGH